MKITKKLDKTLSITLTQTLSKNNENVFGSFG